MGYGSPPWTFRGNALYQLSLVKIEEARKYVPAELPLVNFFGWTLGGFYLARYSDSPVGPFDEMVALAGLVWDFPTSCAWAARVYVNNKEARNHGISAVGLPSRLASFRAISSPHSTTTSTMLSKPSSGPHKSSHNNPTKIFSPSWWDVNAPNEKRNVRTTDMELINEEPRRRANGNHRRGLSTPVCTIEMPQTSPSSFTPKIQLFLPSFSGATPEHPELLKYSLRLMTGVKVLRGVRVMLPARREAEDEKSGEVLDAVLGGKPLVCMAFENMEMEVQSPQRHNGIMNARPVSVDRMQGKTA